MSRIIDHHLGFCIEEIKIYVSGFQTRILPSFAAIEDEAKRLADEEFKRLNQVAPSEYSDEAAIAEKAQEASISYYMSMSATKQGVTNLFGAGLFHLLEQQFDYLVGLVFPYPKSKPKKDTAKDNFVAALRERGIDVRKFPEWKIVLELELIANTVKHGRGASSQRLFKTRPELFFSPPATSMPKLHPQRSLKPIMGNGLYLTDADIVRYSESIATFWSWLKARPELVDY